MSVTYDSYHGAYYSSITGQTYATAQDASDAEASVSGGGYTAPPKPGAGSDATYTDTGTTYDSAAAWVQDRLDPDSPNYAGPGYAAGVDPTTGQPTLVNQGNPNSDQFNIGAHDAQLAPPPTNPNDPMAVVDQVYNQYQQPGPPQRTGAFNALPVSGLPQRNVKTTAQAFNPAVEVTDTNRAALGVDGTTPTTPATSTPPAAAPQVDTTETDKSVAGVNNTIAQLLALANTSPETSAAEAQLMKSDQLARIRDQQSLAQNQAAALGAARSGNRRDQGLLQRQAIAQGNYLGQADQRNQVIQQAELEGNLANLRATEETNDIARKADILSKAGDLGLNVAALQTDISKADLGAATSYINNQFQQLGIDKQISADQSKNVLSYLQAMSAIQYQYDAMSEDDKKHTEDLMMQQYGIDAQTADVLAQIKANKKSTGEKILDGVLGLTESAAPVVAAAITGPANPRTLAGK